MIELDAQTLKKYRFSATPQTCGLITQIPIQLLGLEQCFGIIYCHTHSRNIGTIESSSLF